MSPSIPRDVIRRVRKLVQLAHELHQGEKAFEVTRLTILKGLCEDPILANRFVAYLAHKTLDRVETGEGRTRQRPPKQATPHLRLMQDALKAMDQWLEGPTEALRHQLLDLLGNMRAEQNEFKRIKSNSVRIIHDMDLLLFEYAIETFLTPEWSGTGAYQTARHYAERYEAHSFAGLPPTSAPLVQDIVDFWISLFDLDPAALLEPARPRTTARKRAAHVSEASGGQPTRSGSKRKSTVPFTPRQGQFLAFLHLFRKLHRQAPSELEMAIFFQISPPAVHGMVVKLEELGLIERQPGVARSIRLVLPTEQLPDLEEVAGPPW